MAGRTAGARVGEMDGLPVAWMVAAMEVLLAGWSVLAQAAWTAVATACEMVGKWVALLERG
jgi:hypothetical protein